MTKSENPDDQPTPAPEPGPSPDPTEVTSDERLATLEAALADRDRTIARQAGELALAAENTELLARSREKVGRQKERWIEAKEESAAAKKSYEASLEGHLDLERDLLSGQMRLPFPPPDAPAADAGITATVNSRGAIVNVPGSGYTAALPSVDVAASAAGDESWRPTPLGTLGIADELPHAILARLEDAGIATVGDLADFVRPTASGFCKRLVDIDGIGRVKAEKLEAALDAFWKRWSEWQARTETSEIGEEIDVEFEETADDGPDDCYPDDLDLIDGEDDDDRDQDGDSGA